LYSNDDAVFPRINFSEAFNVIFARVTNPAKLEVDSHNLGKTFLASVINFALLAHIDPNHPFKALPDRFGTFIFYLELLTNNGMYLTVRRPTSGRSAIAIRVSDSPYEGDSRDELATWTHKGLSLESARATLDALFGLTAVAPYDYRKIVGYFLRKQGDYQDIFRIAKFARGKDRDWKPIMARLLGFSPASVIRKYEIDAEIDEIAVRQRGLEEEAQLSSGEYDELRGLIEIKAAAVERLRGQVGAFSFQELEAEVNSDAIGRVEREIGEGNERRYIVDYELGEIARALASEFEFDIEKVRRLFSEVKVAFPAELSRSYDELVEFNRRLTAARSERLRRRRDELSQERTSLTSSLVALDVQRQEHLRLLQSRSTIEKYKIAQRELVKAEGDLANLRARLALLDRAEALESDRAKLMSERADVVAAIRRQVRGENHVFAQIRRTFSSFVEEVLAVPALISVEINNLDNLEFRVRTLDRSKAGQETSESDGFSYHKILCACFDLTLLYVYANANFIRFAYHDGIFEGLDNRKKVNLLALIRRVCADAGVQHVLTVIDTDLPRDQSDNKVMFEHSEIARELNDTGDSGRLFRMPPF
jgi:uncharacterized protein YydD (DUF2326 family)